MRIDALVAELPKEAMANYNAAIKKYPTKFLSFVETIRCGVCRYEIERNTVALIDRAQVFELCGSCGRLLAPKHLPSKVVID
jgi:predicted  nucleic acid-binding Zn-ribbon protein